MASYSENPSTDQLNPCCFLPNQTIIQVNREHNNQCEHLKNSMDLHNLLERYFLKRRLMVHDIMKLNHVKKLQSNWSLSHAYNPSISRLNELDEGSQKQNT